MPMWCGGGGAAPYDDGGCAAAGCGIASCHGRRVRYPRHIGDMRHCLIAYRCDGSRSVLHCDGPCSVSDHRTVSGCRTVIDHHTVSDRHMVSDHRTVSDHHTVPDHHTAIDYHTAIDHHTVPDRHMVSDHRTVSDHHTALRLCGATCTVCVQPLRGCMCPCHHHVVIPSAGSCSR